MEWKIIGILNIPQSGLKYICIQAFKNLKLILSVDNDFKLQTGDTLEITPEGYSLNRHQAQSLKIHRMMPYCQQRWQSLSIQ
ncbi:hypothetical protein ACE2AK_19530 [Rahnella perminowiae]|uniref:hypothetical protein n=1 Tax=Rahnella perminowiae TaxID=2816244 RepID=UPI001C2811BF|nr:hypothetical protein [Rahnella perminowiae]MBU9810977.1 hypothetical protein [Rahnella perminowiae]MBU9823893.1 hypothetical protein [Rahnella perminowiae]MCX2943450.1 hypothetical protein [Rahnella perminowiae]UJD90431.1 hypothetical protein FS594_17485 [Rahnella aquatilis]